MRFRPPPFEVTDRENPFASDTMERRQQIEALTRLVGNIEGPCVLAVDAQWGFGKTAFLKMWAQHLRNEGFPVAEFNAWETDFSDDPLMALYATLKDHFSGLPDAKTDLYETVLETGLILISKVASAAIPLFPDIKEAVEHAKEGATSRTEARLSRYRETREAIDRFKAALQEVRGDKPLVICVDELDRCRPNYAIEFLEATKHVFEVDGVIFILAVNLSELANSVSALYGSDFDARRYLRRFVDRPMNLPPGDRARFLQSLLENTQLTEVISPYPQEQHLLNTYVVGAPHVSLRDIEQGIFNLGAILSAVPRPRGRIPDLYKLAICLVVFRMVAPDIYQRLMAGEVSDLDALQALNRLINRPDDWLKTRLSQKEWLFTDAERLCNVYMETLLIGWSIFLSTEDQSALLDLRSSQVQDKEGLIGPGYASDVVNLVGRTWKGPNGKRRFSRMTTFIEVIAADTP